MFMQRSMDAPYEDTQSVASLTTSHHQKTIMPNIPHKAVEDALTGDIELAKIKATKQAAAPPPDPKLIAKLVVAMSELDLPPSASVEEIKTSYKHLILKYHPDLTAGLSAETQFEAADRAQRINQAYQTLRAAFKF
jgi:hypothetical protein